jgi:hypothetical protein
MHLKYIKPKYSTNLLLPPDAGPIKWCPLDTTTLQCPLFYPLVGRDSDLPFFEFLKNQSSFHSLARLHYFFFTNGLTIVFLKQSLLPLYLNDILQGPYYLSRMASYYSQFAHLFLYFSFFIFFDKVSLCSPGCVHSPQSSASWELGLQLCTTNPASWFLSVLWKHQSLLLIFIDSTIILRTFQGI